MRVALVTTCKNRLDHLALTLPQNLQDQKGHQDTVHVVLDYNDPDMGGYIQREHAADLDTGRLVYYRFPDADIFEMAKAKNMAHRCGLIEGGQVLVNVDADNWIGAGFPAYVDSKFSMARDEQEPIFLCTRQNHRGPGDLVRVRTPGGCGGRIGITRDAFLHAGGYDEIFAKWSPDDKDIARRLQNLGYLRHHIPPTHLRAIKHGWDIRRITNQEAESFSESVVLAGRQDMGVVNGGVIGTGVVYRNFSPEPLEIKPLPTRIFGVGLHKTGTTSLARAFQVLGYDSAHWESPNWAKFIWDEMKDYGRSWTLEQHYTLCDLPIPLLYRELDKAYPGSKFVLTTRDEDAWIKSIKVHWAAMREGWDRDIFSNQVHKELYGTTEFDEGVFRTTYRRHNQEVRDYFRSRPDDLLEIEIEENTSMNGLCRFLDRPPINRRFPHKHRSAEQEKYRQAMGT